MIHDRWKADAHDGTGAGKQFPPAGMGVVITGLLILTACATASRASLPSPAEIPALENARVASPQDVGTLIRLGVAYREAGRLEDAQATLEDAIRIDPSNSAAVFYLGLTYEALDLPSAARDLYDLYDHVGKDEALKRRLAGRRDVLDRQALLRDAREAVSREAELTSFPPQPNTVAVLPFTYRGTDARFAPLSRALAEMLVTDLGQTDRLQVLERTRIQLVLDELDLGESGTIDAASAARSGRLVGAERLVQGQVDVQTGEVLRMDAAVVGTETGALAGTPISEEDLLARLFDMEKRLVLNLYTALGVELTPVERERVTRIPTENVEALLAYGQCLAAEDAGAWEEAAGHCARAATLDPNFEEASSRMLRAEAAASAVGTGIPQLAALGTTELSAPPASAITTPGLADGFGDLESLIPQELPRAPVVETFGTADRSATVDIIIRRPQ